MARPSKLSEKQWETIGKRLLGGESNASLAREYGVSKTAISSRFSKRTETIKEVAKQIVNANNSLSKLDVSERKLCFDVADDLKAMMDDLSSAGRYAAGTAKMHAKAAHDATSKIMFIAIGEDGETVCPDKLKQLSEEQVAVMKSTAIANEASKIPLKIMEIKSKETPDTDTQQKIKVIGGMEMLPVPYDHPPRNRPDDDL